MITEIQRNTTREWLNYCISTRQDAITLTAITILSVTLLSGIPVTQASDQRVLENINVTATRLPRNIEDVAGTVTVLTDEYLRRHLSDNLDDLVRYQPGITMDTAGRGGNQGFIIRGIGGNRVLTLIDGIRSNDIYDAVVAGYGRDVYEVDDLKAIEIIHGPASVLYGADAMGGAVVMQTRDPEDYLTGNENTHMAVRGGYASANEQYKAGITAVRQQGTVGGLLQYTRREYRQRDVNGTGSQNPLDGHSDNLLVKGIWAPQQDQRLALTFDMFREDVDSVLISDLSNTVSSSIGDDQTVRYRASMKFSWHPDVFIADYIESDLHWQTTDALQHSEQRRTSYSFINPMDFTTYGGTEADRISDFEFNQETIGLGVMLAGSAETGAIRHSVVYGFNLDQTGSSRPRNRCETSIGGAEQTTCSIAAYPFAAREVFPNKSFPETKTTRIGIYLQNEMVPGNSRFTLIPGVRFDRYKMNPHVDGLLDVSEFGFDVLPVKEQELSFNVGMIYDFNHNIALSAQYAEGFRPPNYDEANQAFVNRGFGYATVPNAELKPESSRGIELGLKGRFEHAYLSMTMYDNRYKDFINSKFIGMDSGISLFQDSNIGEARIYGMEVSAVWLLTDDWQIQSSLAYARGDDKQADVPLDTIDPLTGVFRLRYRGDDDRWGIETILTLVGDKDRVSGDDRVTADSYGLVDLIGHINLGDNVSMRAGIFNLLDQQYARWANIQGFAAADATTIARAQQPGTNLRINLEYRF